MRHGKFGFQTQIMREDGTLVTNSNIYQQNIDVNDISKYQRRKPRTGASQKVLAKQPKRVIQAQQPIIDDAAVDKADNELLEIMEKYLMDMIEHSYNPLIEQLYSQIL